MSARSAVSVRNRSWTTVNSSSFRIPAAILPALTVEAAGLAPKTNSDRIGGSLASPSSAAPSRFMLTTRPGGGHCDHLWIASLSHLKYPEVLYDRPPPGVPY